MTKLNDSLILNNIIDFHKILCKTNYSHSILKLVNYKIRRDVYIIKL